MASHAEDIKKIALIQRIFPNYRAPIFHALGKKLNTRIFHGENGSGIPQITNEYSEKCNLLSHIGLSYLCTTSRLLRYNPSIVIQEFSLSFVNLYISYVTARLTRKKIILWGHGYDRASGFNPEQRLSDKVRQYFIRRADSVVLYSGAVAKELSQRYPAQRFFVATNSIDSPEKNSMYNELTQKGRERIKIELKFPPRLNICFVARLTNSKKPHLLTDIVEKLQNRGISIMIHLVGDGQLLSSLKETISKRKQEDSFRIYGAIYDEELTSKIIYASDFMIIPAWLGLSINHSLCYGTPVATLANECHPPEIEFAEDGVNAILGNSIDEIVERVSEIWSNCEAYNLMRSSARRYYERKLSLSSMLSGFSNAIEHASRK